MSRSAIPRQQQLAEDWDRRGRPDCPHDNRERLRQPPYYWDTGDYIYMDCGAEWWRDGLKAGPKDAAMFLD